MALILLWKTNTHTDCGPFDARFPGHGVCIRKPLESSDASTAPCPRAANSRRHFPRLRLWIILLVYPLLPS